MRYTEFFSIIAPPSAAHSTLTLLAVNFVVPNVMFLYNMGIQGKAVDTTQAEIQTVRFAGYFEKLISDLDLSDHLFEEDIFSPSGKNVRGTVNGPRVEFYSGHAVQAERNFCALRFNPGNYKLNFIASSIWNSTSDIIQGRIFMQYSYSAP
jgi:hypothetical protein